MEHQRTVITNSQTSSKHEKRSLQRAECTETISTGPFKQFQCGTGFTIYIINAIRSQLANMRSVQTYRATDFSVELVK